MLGVFEIRFVMVEVSYTNELICEVYPFPLKEENTNTPQQIQLSILFLGIYNTSTQNSTLLY